MPLDWKRKDIFTIILVFVMMFSILMPVLGAPSGPSTYRYDEKRSGNSNLVSDIVNPGERWAFETEAVAGSVPVAGDIDSDGEIEVVWGNSDGTIYALDEDGHEEWSYQAPGPFYAPPALGDLDGDGGLEVVIGGYYYNGGDPNLYALNGEDGSVLWTFTTIDKGSSREKGFEASPSIYDINGDGCLDVLIGSRNHYFYALNGIDGSILWQSQFEHFIRASTPIGDIDSDGDDEIFVVDNHLLARLFTMDGTLEWETYLVGYGSASTPIFSDVDGDGFDEIITFSTGWPYNAIEGVPAVYNHDGSLLWTNNVYALFYSTPIMYDMDGDGLLDIVNVDSNNQILIAYKGSDGTILNTAEPFVNKFMGPGLITADIDGDTELEVLVGGNPNLYSINLADFSVDWIYDSEDYNVGGPLVVDLDQDGLAEIVIRISGKLVCLQNQIDPNNLLDEIIEYILGLPDDAFKNNPDQRKNTLVNKLEEVRQMILDGDYQGAIDKLQNDIRPKMDGEGKNDWIISPEAQEDLTAMIDELVEYLESLL